MEQQLTARLRERQVSKFVHDHEANADQVVGDAPN